ncbi:MAG: DUF799 domain-containing protein [Planctomycetes bacterium]|nr:DUF799 domain-containing protein [Planctomycetota bacterium]
MKILHVRVLGALALMVFGLSGCETGPATQFDYDKYLDHMPGSILVLPPLDESPEVDASYSYLSTVTRPLAEQGYYVFPVAMVDAMMRENGLPTPTEMHQVSLQKIDEVFGADAVLYMTVKKWGTSYQVFDSSTTVAIEGRLVDVKSGEVLWHGAHTASHSSNDGNQNGLAGMLVGALVNQIATSASDPSRPLAMQANSAFFGDVNHGLLLGRYHPEHAKDREAHLAARAKKMP